MRGETCSWNTNFKFLYHTWSWIFVTKKRFHVSITGKINKNKNTFRIEESLSNFVHFVIFSKLIFTNYSLGFRSKRGNSRKVWKGGYTIHMFVPSMPAMNFWAILKLLLIKPALYRNMNTLINPKKDKLCKVDKSLHTMRERERKKLYVQFLINY